MENSELAIPNHDSMLQELFNMINSSSSLCYMVSKSVDDQYIKITSLRSMPNNEPILAVNQKIGHCGLGKEPCFYLMKS